MSERPIGDARVITHAYRFANGMVMVFDQDGQQMPEYQGPESEGCWERVLRDAPPSAKLEGMARWLR